MILEELPLLGLTFLVVGEGVEPASGQAPVQAEPVGRDPERDFASRDVDEPPGLGIDAVHPQLAVLVVRRYEQRNRPAPEREAVAQVHVVGLTLGDELDLAPVEVVHTQSVVLVGADDEGLRGVGGMHPDGGVISVSERRSGLHRGGDSARLPGAREGGSRASLLAAPRGTGRAHQQEGATQGEERAPPVVRPLPWRERVRPVAAHRAPGSRVTSDPIALHGVGACGLGSSTQPLRM